MQGVERRKLTPAETETLALRSLREIAAELEAAGHLTSKGTPYGAAAIARMIGR